MSTESPSLIQRITDAREMLGIGEDATLAEIEARAKALLKRWHPDKNADDLEQSTTMTRHILEALETIRDYCARYRYSFRVEEVEKYLSPAEWIERRFGGRPYWSDARDREVSADRKREVSGRRKR